MSGGILYTAKHKGQTHTMNITQWAETARLSVTFVRTKLDEAKRLGVIHNGCMQYAIESVVGQSGGGRGKKRVAALISNADSYRRTAEEKSAAICKEASDSFLYAGRR